MGNRATSVKLQNALNMAHNGITIRMNVIQTKMNFINISLIFINLYKLISMPFWKKQLKAKRNNTFHQSCHKAVWVPLTYCHSNIRSSPWQQHLNIKTMMFTFKSQAWLIYWILMNGNISCISVDVNIYFYDNGKQGFFLFTWHLHCCGIRITII